MPEDINKGYVKRYVDVAKSTNDENLKNNALYRAGTQMEIIPCTGDDKLSPKQQQEVLDAAEQLLGGRNE
ncbi:hypothetical protein [uncultured Nostoc sp.]|uniref:hypothetical protein n=1 Tax=uncultured Nostoc sp. TaxID=340711 RepID=UPI0035CC978F